MFTLIQGIFFNNLIDNWFSLSSCKASSLLVEWLTSTSRRFLLFNYEIRLISKWRTPRVLLQKWVFTNVTQDLFAAIFFSSPLVHIVWCLLILKTLENLLILFGDLDKLSFSSLTIETATCTNSCRWKWLESHRLLYILGLNEWLLLNNLLHSSSITNCSSRISRKKGSSLFLKNASHLLE